MKLGAVSLLPDAPRLWHTVRHLRLEQILNRVIRKLRTSDVPMGCGSVRQACEERWVVPLPKHSAYVSDTQVRFLNKTESITDERAWRPLNASALWTYHLHYFDDMNAADVSAREQWHRLLVAGWIAENRDPSSVGWEPYPISLRSVNWIKWHIGGRRLDQRALDSLSGQLERLHGSIEYHLLGNHIFENAKALLFGGCFFEGERADRWYETGLKLLTQELPEQILADGGHFELSPMYHSIVLEGVLDLVNLGRIYHRRELMAVEERVAPMLRWLDCMTHPDGEMASFNDAAFRQAGSLETLVDYARRLGLNGFEPRTKPLHALPESGYVRVSLGAFDAFLDVGQIGPDYQPGHAHADTLSFELSCNGKRVFVNSGTSLYERCEERMRQRSTAAHNTAVIDGRNSSDVWSSFRVGRRARILGRQWALHGNGVQIEATHDGFSHLAGGPVHSRRWVFSDRQMHITDEITGRGHHSVELFFHLHPDVTARFASDRQVVISRHGVDIGRLALGGGLDWRLEATSYHPEFGISLGTMKLVGCRTGELPVRIETVFELFQ